MKFLVYELKKDIENHYRKLRFRQRNEDVETEKVSIKPI